MNRINKTIKSNPERPHNHPTIIAWLGMAQDTFCDESGFWANIHQKNMPLANTKLLPAEYFRQTHTPLEFIAQKKFLSSGTSSATRAVSSYSKQGLHLYRHGALATFNSVLRHYWHDTPAQGLSLIPQASAAPDSSLATMIAWFAAAGTMTHTTPQTLRAEVRKHKHHLYLWGTVAHYLQLFAQESIPLPAGSLVFETGGIKAGGEDIDLDEFHRRLAKFFHCPLTQVISEYGMCELASQAYRFGGVAEFRFPTWVIPRVKTQANNVTSQALAHTGTGALVLYDYLRCDYPYFICTDDNVALKDKKFKLLGRVSNAPLRGCALNYALDTKIIPTPSTADQSTNNSTTTHVQQRTHILLPALLNFLRTAAEPALCEEFANPKIAAMTKDTLLRSLPTDWQQALMRSRPQSPLPQRWLYILPASHSLAGIYPLCFGYCLGLTILVKLSDQRRLPLVEKIISLLNSLTPAAKIEVHRHRSTLANIDAVLCYGSDTTLTNLRNAYPNLPFAGFGTHTTVAVIAAHELPDLQAKISEDVCAVAQRGCFAVRILFCLGNDIEEAAVLNLQASLSAYDLPVLSTVERHRYQQLGARFCGKQPFQCPILTLDASSELEPLLPHDTSVLPLLLVRDKKLLMEFLQRYHTIKTIACSDSQAFTLAGKVSVKIGATSAQVWNGRHEGRTLFATEKC
ncbi:MAG: hypothetical protein OYH77_02490 [Pseudomonadota bacterium]|nr:hypothetical protein [Pseudomonadota bacterium]